MFSSRISTVITSRVCRPHFTIWQQLQNVSVSAVYHFEDFIDREFAKAQRDLDTDTLENPRSLLQKLERDQKWRIQATRRARTSRLFKQPNEQRILNWDTIEQIRYLKQEHGSEWTTKKLATSFSITEALIIKVLKSKFVPSEYKHRKQDERAKINAGLLPEKIAAATRHTDDKKALQSVVSKADYAKIVTPLVKTPTLNVDTSEGKPPQHQSQKISGQRSAGKFQTKEESSFRQAKPYNGKKTSKADGRTSDENLSFVSQTGKSSDAKCRQGHTVAGRRASKGSQIYTTVDMEQDVDGTNDVEELNIDIENLESYDDGMPPPRIIRKGNSFFDENGDFLYRV